MTKTELEKVVHLCTRDFKEFHCIMDAVEAYSSASNNGNTNVSGSFVISPELPIGTEFWFLWNGKMEFGLIAAYQVSVTSCVESSSWHSQLFARWLNKKAKDIWRYSFRYEVKVDMSIMSSYIEKKRGQWYLLDTPIFFSIDELKGSL